MIETDLTLSILIVPISIIAAFAFVFMLYKKIGEISTEGYPEAVKISNYIRVGSLAFLRRQYTTVIALSIPVAIVIFIGFWQVFPTKDVDPIVNATFTTLSFIIGSGASLVAGYIAMDIATKSNIKAAVSAEKSIGKSLRVGFDGGLVMGLSIVGMSLLGVAGLFALVFLANGIFGFGIQDQHFPILLIGLGFGASYTALFAQLGGGIYTKAADMGADLVGKIEAGIPEDDARNPGVIADLVGDMVGDCAGRGADLFESATAENIGAMVIAILFYQVFGLMGFVFPLVLRAGGIFATLIGQYFVQLKNENEDPMKPLFRGLYITTLVCIAFFFGLIFLTLGQIPEMSSSGADGFPRWIYLFLAGSIGILSSLLIGWVTDYYTGKHRPVNDIVEASKSGYATNVLSGFTVGLESTLIPILILVLCVLSSYWLGFHWILSYGGQFNAQFGSHTITAYEGGVFGTAVATMGILATTGYVLAMDGYGPISDNAGGIVEMSGMPDSVREKTDALDIVGNTTKALTKGFAIASAALAAFLLFEAYLTVLTQSGYQDKYAMIGTGVVNAEIFANRPLMTFIDPLLLLGGFIGAVTVFIFTAQAIRAVNKTAIVMIEEIRRQFREIPGIMEGTATPDYASCVDISTKYALKNMVSPGLVVFAAPLLTGFILGPNAAAAFLIFGTVTGVLMGLFLNNAGGAFDNAKKIAKDNQEAEPETFKAAVVGDTIGDPFKDTAGPSIHVLVKLINNILLTFAGLFITYNLASYLF
jgi:K(+)-stimulated pyrophosphate-energized sodium pump